MSPPGSALAPLGAGDEDALVERLGLEPGSLARSQVIPDGAWFRARKAGGAVVVRVSSETSLDHERPLLETLAQAHFPTPLPLHAPVRIPSGTATLFPSLAGETVGAGALEDDALDRLGEELGKLHRLANAVPRALPRMDWSRPERRVLDLGQHPLRQIGAAAGALRANLSLPDPGPLPGGPLHGAFGPHAVRWLSGRISAVLGFERAGTGPWLFEVAYALSAFCCEPRREASARFLLQGYERQRPLTGLERECLPRMLSFAARVRGVDRLSALALLGEDERGREVVDRALAISGWALDYGHQLLG